MTKILFAIFLAISLAVPASAQELTPPQVPQSGARWMPDNTDSFGSGLIEIVKSVTVELFPNLHEASRINISVICAALVLAIVQIFQGKGKLITDLIGTTVIASILLHNTDTMIGMAAETVQELTDYGKLLCPIMTAALAAQGGVNAATVLYTGTTLFDSVLSTLISQLLVPMVYLFLALTVANSAVGEDLLRKMCDLIKRFTSWCLKTILTVFTTYMSISGVVSGTTDAAALKAAKVTISSAVPVVGGILSDASEAVLVSAGIAKSTAGVYGILAILAVFLAPFLKIGCQYLLLKFTAAVCAMIGTKSSTALVEDFSTAMGLLLAMTGSVCLLLLISTVCFMKGVT